ncbi:MAG: dipeptidase, partial [Deltaproteobacteria bacterium]
MKRVLYTVIALIFLAGICQASEEGKTWPASDKAKQFVKDTIVVEFYAPPFG